MDIFLSSFAELAVAPAHLPHGRQACKSTAGQNLFEALWLTAAAQLAAGGGPGQL